MKRNTIITLATLFVTLVLIGIPTAAEYYPERIPVFLQHLPIGFISTWLRPLAIFFIGCVVGWYVRGIAEETPAKKVTIEGCIRKDGVLWRGTASVSDGTILDTHVPYEPRCPDCLTKLKPKGKSRPSLGSLAGGGSKSNTKKRRWVCPNDKCGHSTERSSGKHEEAEKLFERHIEKIVDTSGEDYSLDSLREEIDGEVTGRDIWEQYTEVVDDTHVSNNCF